MTLRIALLGFGIVAQGLTGIPRDKGKALQSSIGFDGRIVAISDPMKGSLYHPEGLDLNQALKVCKRHGKRI